jgi:hypothetical protein
MNYIYMSLEEDNPPRPSTLPPPLDTPPPPPLSRIHIQPHGSESDSPLIEYRQNGVFDHGKSFA